METLEIKKSAIILAIFALLASTSLLAVTPGWVRVPGTSVEITDIDASTLESKNIVLYKISSPGVADVYTLATQCSTGVTVTPVHGTSELSVVPLSLVPGGIRVIEFVCSQHTS